MKKKSIDRRREGRFEMSSPVLVTTTGRDALSDAPGILVDLSATGMRVHMWVSPPKHRMANVRVDMNNEVFQVRCRIVRVETAEEGGYLVGLEFDPECLTENPFPTCALVEVPAVRTKNSVKS